MEVYKILPNRGGFWVTSIAWYVQQEFPMRESIWKSPPKLGGVPLAGRGSVKVIGASNGHASNCYIYCQNKSSQRHAPTGQQHQVQGKWQKGTAPWVGVQNCKNNRPIGQKISHNLKEITGETCIKLLNYCSFCECATAFYRFTSYPCCNARWVP